MGDDLEPDELEGAREALRYLEETERFLLVEVSPTLKLGDEWRWADQVRDVRERIACQKVAIKALEVIHSQ